VGTEIERKFLVTSDGWRREVQRRARFRQGYLANNEHCSIRVRLAGDEAWLNIKGATLAVRRQEYEYGVPVEEANEMLDTLAQKPIIEKTRHYVDHAGHLWEVDEFEGDNASLVVAEIELRDTDEAFEKPDWIGKEVSDDPRYYNVNLVAHPFKDW
jgi:adenylate cyclase